MTTIAPWLAVRNAQRAADFYKAAFGAVEVYRLDGDEGTIAVAQLSIEGSVFWIQDDAGASPERRGRGLVRMILSIDDPDTIFDRAVAAGAPGGAPLPQA